MGKFISGMGMPQSPHPKSKFDYPDGAGRFCAHCDQWMQENEWGTVSHLMFEGRSGCFPLLIQIGWLDGKPVVTEARFL